MIDLSVLIPARNEMFLSRTIEDILKNIEGNTEVITVLDGAWDNPKIPDDPRVTVIYHNQSIGQRAATNEACKLSKAKYVMKVDAHCAFDKGFDVKMIREMQDNYTMVPIMYNLHAFDWVCTSCQNRIYQGPTPEKCEKCGGKMERDILWQPRLSRKSTSYRFDSTLHFQYFNDYTKRPGVGGDLTETMSLQGSCFMLTREKYWELNICDEEFGSWGQQGTEVACKTWLSGGRVVCNHKTWYSHMFRTQGGDFGFPYPLSGNQVDHARKYCKELFLDNTWPKQIYPLSWLLEKFKPVPGWHDNEGKDMLQKVTDWGKKFKSPLQTPSKGIIYYTDNRLNLKIAHSVQHQLTRIGLPIVSASLKPMNFGQNIHLPLERGYLTMAKQILAALESSNADVIFFCEHDVLYHPSHFDFIPPKKDVYYYNTNVWKVRADDGHALHYDCQQLSGLCAYRELLLQHFRERVRRIEKEGFTRRMGFEPGTHNRPERIDDFKAESWQSKYPNIDIRHDQNLTDSRWSQDQFRNQKFTEGWTESEASKIEGWKFNTGKLF